MQLDSNPGQKVKTSQLFKKDQAGSQFLGYVPLNIWALQAITHPKLNRLYPFASKVGEP